MGIFIDRHAPAVVPNEAFARMIRESEEQAVDPGGVRIVGHWLDDDCLYCVLEAPSSQAVCEHHASRGVPCEDLRQIEDAAAARPVATQLEPLVRASIATFWASPPAAR